MALSAGRLDRRIEIQRRAEPTELDEYGHPRPTGSERWVTHARVWAEVHETTARQREQSPQILARRNATMTIRYRPDVTVDMRIIWDGVAWDIKGRAEIGRREGLQLAVEVVEVPS